MVRTEDLVSLIDEAGNACPTDLTVLSTELETLPDGQQRGKVTTDPLARGLPEPQPVHCSCGLTISAGGVQRRQGLSGADAGGGQRIEDPGRLLLPPRPFPQRRQQGIFVENPDFRTASAYLKLTNPESLELVRGDQLIVTADSGLQPFSAAVDTASSTAGLTAFRLPGPVVHTKVGDVDFAYIAYPSADGILQVSLAGLVDNAANIRGLVPFQ